MSYVVEFNILVFWVNLVQFWVILGEITKFKSTYKSWNVTTQTIGVTYAQSKVHF